MQITPWDLLLVLVVSLQVTALAYLRAPKWKAFALTLPFPFTVIALSVGRPMDATNICALPVLFVYIQSIRILYQRAHFPIVRAIATALSGYAVIGWTLARLLPATDTAFWMAAAGVLTFAFILHRYLPIRLEPGHRTTLPLWQKLPIIIGIVCILLLIKTTLRGFSTLFPLVGVIGAYEARHSLWTLGKQLPILMLTLVPLMIVSRLTWQYIGFGPSLALGWLAFLFILQLLLRPMWAKWNAMERTADESSKIA